jgi:four helix bundle protein
MGIPRAHHDMTIKKYEDLEVWKFAHQFVLDTYRITKGFPADERYGLISQMRRSAVSIPANIAEGFGRRHSNDKIHFYNMSQTSLDEVTYYYRLARDLGCINDTLEVTQLLDSTARMLNRLIQKTPDLPFFS